MAFFPTFVILGIALPVSFLAWIERYLYYLAPRDLLPTYATAWLVLACATVPVSLACWLGLRASRRFALLRWAYAVFRFVLFGSAALAIAGALGSALLLWIRSFGILTEFDPRNWLAICVGLTAVVTAASRRGRSVVLKQYGVARFASVLGALTLVCLPFHGWNAPTVNANPVEHGQATAASDEARPNVLLITIDTLSAQHMSLYGAARLTTPNLDAFARDATTFDRAYANGNFTTAGMDSILTATRPWTHRALQLPGWPILAARTASLPAVLSQAGYQTGYVTTNPWAGANRNGVGMYYSFLSDNASTLSPCHDMLSAQLRYICPAAELLPFRFAQMLLGKLQQIAFDHPKNWQSDPRPAINAATTWLARTDNRSPVFLWLHLMPPHSPYAAPAPWLGEFDASPEARTAADSATPPAYLFSKVSAVRARVLADRYDEALKYSDYYVGKFLDSALPLLGGNTLVIVTADHGESFAHGYGMHTGPGLFESLIRIPLIVKFPFQKVGARTSFMAEQADIGPTIADVVGAPQPVLWEGQSLRAAGDTHVAGSVQEDKPAFSMNFEQNPKLGVLKTGSIAVIDNRWKLIHYMGALHYALMPRLTDELYDLSADPRETRSVIAEQPEQAKRLADLIATGLSRHGGSEQ